MMPTSTYPPSVAVIRAVISPGMRSNRRYSLDSTNRPGTSINSSKDKHPLLSARDGLLSALKALGKSADPNLPPGQRPFSRSTNGTTDHSQATSKGDGGSALPSKQEVGARNKGLAATKQGSASDSIMPAQKSAQEERAEGKPCDVDKIGQVERGSDATRDPQLKTLPSVPTTPDQLQHRDMVRCASGTDDQARPTARPSGQAPSPAPNETQLYTTSYEEVIARQADRVEQLELQVFQLQNLLSASAASQTTNGIGASRFLGDNDIKQQWQTLAWQVRQCMEGVTMGADPPNEASDCNPSLSSLTPHWRTFSGSRQKRVHLCEAIVWDVLTTDVFANDNSIGKSRWAGSQADSLSTLGDVVHRSAVPHKDFHHWRCQTSSLFSSLSPDSKAMQEHVDDLVRKVESRLRHLAMHWIRGEKDTMKSVLKSAIALDSSLKQQRAWWYCQYPVPIGTKKGSKPPARWDIRFDETSMITPDRTPGKEVILMVSPALMKAGNSSGDHYDDFRVMTPSTVVCTLGKSFFR